MSDVLERNVARMVRAWAHREDPAAQERACAEFLRRLRTPSVSAGRVWPGAAAALLLGLLAWILSRSDGAPPSPTPAQDAPRRKEIDEWLASLRHEDLSERARAEKNLLGLGEDVHYALRALARLRASDDAEQRGRADQIWRRLAERVQNASLDDHARRAVQEVRVLWRKRREALRELNSPWSDRDDKHIEEAVRLAFSPYRVSYVHYAATYEVADHMESNDGESFQKFKGFSRIGGNRDLLVADVQRALKDGEGIVFVDNENDPSRDIVVPPRDKPIERAGECMIFTLPEGGAWSSYVIVKYAPAPRD